MLSKLTTTHIILIAAAVVIVGLFIGNMIGKSNTTGNGDIKLGKVAGDCPTSGGVPCCPPRRWRFNGGVDEYQCV